MSLGLGNIWTYGEYKQWNKDYSDALTMALEGASVMNVLTEVNQKELKYNFNKCKTDHVVNYKKFDEDVIKEWGSIDSLEV